MGRTCFICKKEPLENNDMSICKKCLFDKIYTKKYFLNNKFCGENEFTMGRSIKFLNPEKGDVILDIGSGKGGLLNKISNDIKRGVGIDFADDAISISTNLLKNKKNIIIEKMDCRALRFENNSFDKIVMLDLIEHLTEEDGIKTINEGYRILKKGGYMVLHTAPNSYFFKYSYPLIQPILRLFNKKEIINSINEKRNRWELKYLHINELNPFSLKSLIKKSNFDDYKIILEKDILRDNKYFLTKDLKIINPLIKFISFKPILYFLTNDLYAVLKK